MKPNIPYQAQAAVPVRVISPHLALGPGRDGLLGALDRAAHLLHLLVHLLPNLWRQKSKQNDKNKQGKNKNEKTSTK